MDMDIVSSLPYDDPAIYDLRTAGFLEDLRLFYREAARWGSPALELACGTGRVAIPLLKRGIEVVGLDRDRQMLARARHNAGELGLRFPVVRADMTRFAFRRPFQLIYIAFASLHDLPRLELWKDALRCVRRALDPGGCFLLDERLPPPPTGSDPHFFRTLKAPNGRTIDCYHCLELDQETQQSRGELLYHMRAEDGTETVKRYPFCGTFAHKPQIEQMLKETGFDLLEVQGAYTGRPWQEGDERMIFLASPG